MKPKNQFARANAEAAVAGIDLRTVWDVDERPGYDVRRTGAAPEHLVAIRTHRGLGRVLLPDAEFELSDGSLLVVRNESITRYYCAADEWAFWWFEFASLGMLPCAVNRLLHSPVRLDWESDMVKRIMSALCSPSPDRRRHASAGLAWLLTGCLAEQTHPPGPPLRRRAAIERIVLSMHQRLAGNWPVPEMAREAGMSERLFRNCFTELTGMAPKAFYLRIRLDAAMEHLRLGQTTVKELADMLGFSSPFHLSREFRRRFGVPPSAVRRDI